MSKLTILRGYAQKANPTTLPPSILLSHTATSLTIFDAYPKSIFHLLILPRITPPLTVFDLASLRTLLKCDKTQARKVLESLERDAKNVRAMIEEEMIKRYGFKWDVWTGFHAVPSMEHVHLHIISADLCSSAMKNKKHYNSFHPKLGFFIHLDEVLSWFDSEPSYFSEIAKLKPSRYESLLKEDLLCWRCGQDYKNMPTLKTHLQHEWDEQAKREKAKLSQTKKRNFAEVSPDQPCAANDDCTEIKRQKQSPTA
ncbi:hypothetical protein AcV5_010007 [Taiwanofungus camphoratus]|nr:hypothetical protein AcV5_010007 [Antrodia cinnamomea]